MLSRHISTVQTVALIYMVGSLDNMDIIRTVLYAVKETPQAHLLELHTLILERVYVKVHTVFLLLSLRKLCPNFRHIIFHWYKGDLLMDETVEMLLWPGGFETVRCVNKSYRVPGYATL